LRIERDLHADGHVGRSTDLDSRFEPAADSSEPGGSPTLELILVGAFDACRHIRQGQDPEEVNVDGIPPLGSNVLDYAPEERGLPKTPRCDKSAVVSFDSSVEQRASLTIAIDQLAGRDRLAVTERIDAPEYRAKWLTNLEPNGSKLWSHSS
jgi:hypothetical protein